MTSPEQNKAIVRRFIHEGVICGNLSVIDELQTRRFYVVAALSLALSPGCSSRQ